MTKIIMDDQEVETFKVHFMGEFVWLEGITKEGKKIRTLWVTQNKVKEYEYECNGKSC